MKDSAADYALTYHSEVAAGYLNGCTPDNLQV
jgi:hypothetical protein